MLSADSSPCKRTVAHVTQLVTRVSVCQYSIAEAFTKRFRGKDNLEQDCSANNSIGEKCSVTDEKVPVNHNSHKFCSEDDCLTT